MTRNALQWFRARTSPSKVHLRFEELDQRALPNATQPIQQVARDIWHDVASLHADIQSQQTMQGANVGANGSADLTGLNSALLNVQMDLMTGVSASADLNTLTAADNQLRTDLGNNGSRDVDHQLQNTHRDVQDLSDDVTNLNQTASRDMAHVQSAAQALTSDLGTNVSATTSADLTALNTAVSNMAADQSAGVSTTGDINALHAARVQLTTDLGNNTSESVERDLRNLRQNAREQSEDRDRIENVINRTGNYILADAHTITMGLSSNTDATIMADVAAMNRAATQVAVDLTNGTSATTDIATAYNAQSMLSTDLGTNGSQDVSNGLRDLNTDLMNLALELTALRA